MNLIFITDQFTAALREVLAEYGYNVKISLATEVDGQMKFVVASKDGKLLTPDLMEKAMAEAANRSWVQNL